jgi:FtsH-binding integral membrane protein
MQKDFINHPHLTSEPTQENLWLNSHPIQEQNNKLHQPSGQYQIPIQNFPYNPDQPLNADQMLLANNMIARPNHQLQYPTSYEPINNFGKDSNNPNVNITPIMPTNTALPENNEPLPQTQEDPEIYSFSNKNVRLGFIKKVYLILSTQLLITFLVVLASFLSKEFRDFQARTTWLLIVFSVLTFIIIIVLACFPSVSRKVPINYILLFAFTIGEAYIVSYVCSRSDPDTVLIATGLTLGIVITLTLYAAFTKSDFTFLGGFLLVCLISLIIGGIAAYFFRNKWLNLVLSIVGAIIFGIYIIFDTQLIIGNKGLKFRIDDYILAAINLYLDIVMLFLYILRIVGAANN